jgi:hypothetical protein
MFHKLLNISQNVPRRYQFIAKLAREITHPSGVLAYIHKIVDFFWDFVSLC